MLERIQEIISDQIRPVIQEHGGDIKIVSFEEGNLRIRLLGSCLGCQEAMNTTEHLVKKTLVEGGVRVEDVILETGVSQDIIDMARKLLANGE